jgi:CRISPR-associated protein Csd1
LIVTSGVHLFNIDPKYLFGIDWDRRNKKLTVTKNSLLAFSKCKENNMAFLDGLSSPVINAFKNFLKQWEPKNELQNPHLTALDKQYDGAKFVVTVQEDITKPLNRDPSIKEKWEESLRDKPVENKAVMGQCSISGEYGPIARIHDKLTGIPGGDTCLTCMKTSAFWSYGHKESYNSSVSQEIMKKYT